MPQKEAREIAIQRIREQLQQTLPARRSQAMSELCLRLGIPVADDGISQLKAFGQNLRLDWQNLDLTKSNGQAASQTDQILLFHYLASPGATKPGGDLISFRDLTGGIFYWEPFRSRTVLPLIQKFGDDHQSLAKALDRFDWEKLPLGDFGARIHGFGNLWLTLVCYAAEEGIPAEINALFDPVIRQVYQAEDAAVFAGRICLSLLA